MTEKYIDIPIFHQRIYFTDWEHAKENNNNNDLDLYEAICYIDKDDRICFCCDREARDGLLVHESIHLANFIIYRCLIYATPQHDEVTAYLSQFIYEKIKKKFNNISSKIKNL